MSRYFEHTDLENDFLVFLSSQISKQIDKDTKFENLDDKWSIKLDKFVKYLD